MPRFAANLSMMFTEVPFPQRFEAAARAGFTAVEFLFPYEYLFSLIDEVGTTAGSAASIDRADEPKTDWDG